VEIIPKKFSKYAHSLEKLFKNYSLETLKKNINNPRKVSIREFDLDYKLNNRVDK
jgi:hypothetical protein